MMLQKPFIIVLMLLSAQLAVADQCIPWNPDLAKQKSPGNQLKIGRIIIETNDVFDLSNPKESRFFHHWANKLHITTKTPVVARQLLFKEGDPFLLRKLQESERLLRANRYIKDASVTPVELCGDKATIKVKTRDKWTLTPGASFGRSGGKNKSGVEIEEHNLFGLGKSLSLSYSNNSERNSTLLAYTDPQLLGSRKRFFASIQDNSDGKGHEFGLDLPFYELDSRRAWGVHSASIQQENSFYDKGDVVEKIKEDQDTHSLFYGWSTGHKENHVSRFKVGWQYKQRSYQDANSLQLGSSSRFSLPLSNVESYPWFEYEYTEEKFTEKTNFKTMGQIEDVSLGDNFTARIGLLNKRWGSDDNHVRLSTTFSKGYQLGARNLGFIHIDTNSYLGNGLLEGEKLSLQGEWYSFNKSGNNYYFSGKVSEQSNFLPGEQFLLGGETGLRGYPKGYQTGDKSVLLTAEKRFHFNWYPLHIAKFGAVAFADVGTAWGGDNDPNVLADIGIGLRMVPTRSSSAKTLHLDLAVPLNERGKVDGFQFLIKTRKSF